MQFAWLREKSANDVSVKQGFNNPFTRIVFIVYNAVFWIFLLPFFTPIDYSTGFILYTIVIFIRLIINLVTNNFVKLTPENYKSYPFRIP